MFGKGLKKIEYINPSTERNPLRCSQWFDYSQGIANKTELNIRKLLLLSSGLLKGSTDSELVSFLSFQDSRKENSKMSWLIIVRKQVCNQIIIVLNPFWSIPFNM